MNVESEDSSLHTYIISKSDSDLSDDIGSEARSPTTPQSTPESTFKTEYQKDETSSISSTNPDKLKKARYHQKRSKQYLVRYSNGYKFTNEDKRKILHIFYTLKLNKKFKGTLLFLLIFKMLFECEA